MSNLFFLDIKQNWSLFVLIFFGLAVQLNILFYLNISLLQNPFLVIKKKKKQIFLFIQARI